MLESQTRLKKIPDWVVYSLLVWAIYGIGIVFFDFWSDDFGYFLNFRRVLSEPSGLYSSLASYLTGGVPRLQLGWHLTHQVLFLFFGTSVVYYFAVQCVILVLNSVLLNRTMAPLVGKQVSFWSGVFLIVCPFYRESFYWVSANYGFFQVFFFLLTWLAVDRALLRSGKRRLGLLSVAAVSLVFSCLYQEQTITFLPLFPVVYLLAHAATPSATGGFRARFIAVAQVFLIGCVLFVALYLPQLLVIDTSGSASLAQSIQSYYPHPLQSLESNIPKLLRWTFGGILPSFEHLYGFGNHLSSIRRLFILLMALSTITALCAVFAARRVDVAGRSSRGSWRLVLAIVVWWLGSSIVVMPLVEYLSRYVYVVLPPALLLVLTVLFKFGRVGRIAVPLLALICAVELQSFFYGAYFQLIQVERKAYNQVAAQIKLNPDIKGVVFRDFPVTLNHAVSGVWLNFHATNWWLKWRSLPEKLPIEIVGNNIVPQSKTPFSPGGLRLIYEPYPRSRMKKIYQPNEILIADFKGSAFAAEPNIEFSIRAPFARRLIEKPSTISKRRKARNFYLPKSLGDLRGCNVDVVATAEAKGTLAAISLFDGRGHQVSGAAAYSSGLASGESKVFFRTTISSQGPYFVRLTQQPHPVTAGENREDWSINLKKLHVFGCGAEYEASQFLDNHNPDPAFPILRYVNPQMNYSIVMPYPNAQMWEVPWALGINDARSAGDYYCYPDDRVTIEAADGKRFSAYVGMLSFKREVVTPGDSFQVTFSRKQGDPLTQRGSLDRMSKEEFDGYWRDQLPLDISTTHRFKLDRNYSTVSVSLRSRYRTPMKVRWIFEDSAVFDFGFPDDKGVGTVVLSSGVEGQEFRSTRPPEAGDVSINHRLRYPLLPNVGAFDFSMSPLRGGSFLSGGYSNQSFSEQPKDLLTYGGKIPADKTPPHRVHGLWFDVELQPNETKTFDYAKVFLSDWYDKSDLRQSAWSSIEKIKEDRATERALK
jgi:hypothetical protein